LTENSASIIAAIVTTTQALILTEGTAIIDDGLAVYVSDLEYTLPHNKFEFELSENNFDFELPYNKFDFNIRDN